MLHAIRKSPLYLRARRSGVFTRIVQPIVERRHVQAWWDRGRQVPAPHAVKMVTLSYWADRIGARHLVETGAYLGDTIRMFRGRFDTITSIEIAEVFANPLKAEFRDDPTVRVVHGDSGSEIARVVSAIREPALFWLDAHYSGGETGGEGYVPIYAEIDAVGKLGDLAHAIVIDDMRLFTGRDGYPTTHDLIAYLAARGYETVIVNDMMQAWRKSDGAGAPPVL